MKKIRYGYLLLFIALFGIDRITKYGALQYLSEKPYAVHPFLSFELAINRGISWSLFSAENRLLYAGVTLLVGMIIGMLFYYTYQRYWAGYQIIGEVMVLAGAVSNFVDRIWYAGVVDFIALSYNQWMWPIFNVADMTILTGIAYMLFTSIQKL
jgi:signal peptidase II